MDEEPTKVDLAASEACVRSGTFALLLSVALLLLVPSWREQPNYAALRRYLGDRINLANQVDQLSDDPSWQKYKASSPGAESMSIAELLGVSVAVSSTERAKKTDTVPKPAPPSRQQATKGRLAPEPATTLTAAVMGKIDQMPYIADTLRRLNDSDVLTRSRRVSNVFMFSITRWVDKRDGLAFRNQVTNNCFIGQLEAQSEVRMSDDLVTTLQNEALLNCLSFRNVAELAHMELPSTSPPQVGEHVSPQIDVTLGSSLPHNLYAASLLAQGLLFFVMVYFSAFVREAALSPNFPAPGTLFSAFSRSRVTLFIFALATFVPALASALVCWASWSAASAFRIFSSLLTAFIIGVFLSIQLVLWPTTYFKGLLQMGE